MVYRLQRFVTMVDSYIDIILSVLFWVTFVRSVDDIHYSLEFWIHIMHGVSAFDLFCLCLMELQCLGTEKN